jgi:class 3 adenylate cyclase
MQAEKQELTILFCDLLGSTELAEKLSLDHFLEIMQRYHECLYQCITMHYGYVAQHLGDGIMAYFGFPVKFSIAPSNAVKAGFSLLEQVPQMVKNNFLKDGIDLSIRISVHTGTVVMVDLGIGERKERLALGGPPNIAARLQNLAPVNGIVVSEATYELTKNQFDYETLGGYSIKGVAEKMNCYRPILRTTS